MRLELFERGGHAGMLLRALRHLSVVITLALLYSFIGAYVPDIFKRSSHTEMLSARSG